MNTETNNTLTDQPKQTRRRNGKSALVFALLLSAGSMAGLSQINVAHAQGPSGAHGGGMDPMSLLGFEGHDRADKEARRDRPHKGSESMREKRLTRMLDAVDATDQQREQIKVALGDLKKQVKPLRAEGKEHRKTLRKLMTADQINATEIEQERLAMVNLADRVSQQVTATMIDVTNLLEPEQRKQLAEMRPKRVH
ncbi:MAG: Spy/CpxP family protein refolding chaperone [Immundisolibacteraceae bacterium]|nr:Spy/CpxP family protein refolding chaperone [Immundisolibacteraceae bacterium]